MIRAFRCDLHLHTCLSPCADLDLYPTALVRRAVSEGLDVIAITDHNTIQGALFAQSLAEMYDFEVVVGSEVSSSEGHILGLFLQEDVAPGMTPAETIAAILGSATSSS